MPRTSIRKERGQRLARVRQAAGLSQTYIAEQIGRSRQVVGSWEEGGNISADDLSMYCALCGVTPNDVILGSPQELGADLSRQFAAVPEPLRSRLWMLYEVFLRPGIAPDIPRAARSDA